MVGENPYFQHGSCANYVVPVGENMWVSLKSGPKVGK